MGTLRWNAGNGSWDVAGNWSVVSGANTVPTITDAATIDAPGFYTIAIAGPAAADLIQLNHAGATLDITGALTLGTSLVGTAGTILANNATISGGAISGNVTATNATFISTTIVNPIQITGGTLDGVTLQGAFTSGGSSLLLRDGLSFAPGGSFSYSFGSFSFDGSQTLDGGKLEFAGAPSLATTADLPAGATLTIAPGADLFVGNTFGSGSVTLTGGGTIVNFGTFEPRRLAISQSVVNHGTMLVPGAFPITMNGAFANDGVVTVGGTLNAGPVSGAGTFALGSGVAGVGNAVLSGTFGAGTVIRFLPGDALLAAGINSGATLENFHAGDTIQIALPNDGGITTDYSGTPAGGTLTLSESGTMLAQFHLTGINPGATFSLGGDPSSTTITTTNAACFRNGTRIRTLRGDVPVEDLRIGDLVPALRTGRPLPVIWIGHRRLRCASLPSPASVWPVVIHAHAIADGIPHRDLWLSPEHAVFLHGVLVPVRLLINGTTIRQVPCAAVHYLHVELPAHDLILSEGMPTESYLDTGNRHDFENAGPVIALQPSFAPDHANRVWQARACAPQLRAGPQLASIRRVLQTRADRLTRREPLPRIA